MATRFYFHDAANDLPGTFPTAEQSAETAEWTATGATTLRKMGTSIGAAQASLAGSSSATTAAQDGFLGFFCSPPLDVNQTVGGGNMILNAAEQESNTSMNFWINSLCVYVWRPSNGTKVGNVRDAAGTSLGGTEPTLASSEQATHITAITSTGVSALADDVVICEIWVRHTQSMSVSYTGTFFYDGTAENTTENAAVTNHASFLELAESLTFKSGHPAMRRLGRSSMGLSGVRTFQRRDHVLPPKRGIRLPSPVEVRLYG